MRIIDTLTAYLANASRRPQSGAATFDPILHVTDGSIWTLGMTLSMWAYVFRRDADEICQRDLRF